MTTETKPLSEWTLPTGIKRAGELLSGVNKWPDLPKVKLDQLQEVDFILQDVAFGTVPSNYAVGGSHHAAGLLCVSPETGELFTVLVSQEVLVKQVHELVNTQALPVLATFRKAGRYWTLA